MDRASSLIYPGSKTLAGWWRQMLPRQPQAFWVGYIFVHRVEAPVNVLKAEAVDPFTHLVLQALALDSTHHLGLLGLVERLGLPPAAVRRVLVEMEKIGFLLRKDNDRWQMSDLGRSVAQPPIPSSGSRNGVSSRFVAEADSTFGGQRVGPPDYVPLE